jgi:hypothetical protein
MNHALNEFILDKYLRIVLNSHRSLFGDVSSNREGYNFRCNVCGDSKRSKYKRRGYILKRKSPWMYFCFNCSVSIPAHVWMKKYFYQHYAEYVKESMQLDDIKPKEQILPEIKHEVERPNITESEDLQYFKPICLGQGRLFDLARELCISRCIPTHVWKKWFVAVDGKYVGRLIIPFYDRDGNIYYFQARSLYKKASNKYINMVENRDEAIYNYDFISRERPVVLVEGPIDSLFVENSIAVLGLKFSEVVKAKVEELSPFYLLDFDKDGLENSYKLLLQGKPVFLWERFKHEYNLPNREKWDLNDAYIYLQRTSPFTFEELQPFFTTSVFDKIHLVPRKYSVVRKFI